MPINSGEDVQNISTIRYQGTFFLDITPGKERCCHSFHNLDISSLSRHVFPSFLFACSRCFICARNEDERGVLRESVYMWPEIGSRAISRELAGVVTSSSKKNNAMKWCGRELIYETRFEEKRQPEKTITV